MPLRRLTLEMDAKPLIEQGVVPRAFFEHNESIEILRVYAFQPRERVLLVRVVRSGPALSPGEIQARRETLRRRYGLRDFEILRVEADGRAYVALLRQDNPGVLEAVLQELGAGATPTTPTVVDRDVALLSFLADEAAERDLLALLDRLGVPYRLRSRTAVRHPVPAGDDDLTPRQREILSLAWNLGYFDIPGKIGLAKLAGLTGLSRNAVSQHLRRGLRKVLKRELGT